MDESTDEWLNLDELLLPPRQRGMRRLPRLVAGGLKLVWTAARREFLWVAFLQILAGAGLAGQVLLARELLARVLVVESRSSFDEVVPWLAAMVVVTTVVAFANLAKNEQQRLLSELVGRHAIDQVLDVATAVDLLTFDVPAFHNRIVRAYTNAVTRPAQMASGVLGITAGLVTIVGIASALVFIEPLFLLIVMLAYLPLWAATARASRMQYFFTVRQTERDRRRDYLAFILTRKDEAAEVRAFGLAGPFRSRFDVLYDERIAELRTVIHQRMRLGLVGGLASQALNGAVLGVVIWFIASGRLELPQAGAAAAAVVLLSQRLGILAGGAASLYESSLFIEDFTTFVGAMPAIERGRATKAPPETFHSLTVEDVTFTYPSRDEPALEGISLEVGQGQIIALVGENGSGKTTLAKLLAGLYTPALGAVRWDGIDLKDCDPRLVRASIGVIFQDYAKYMLSAMENITAGRPEQAHDTASAIDAAKRAGAHDFIEDLVRGYDTQLGAQFFGGSDLSLGQWQRIAMARAVFRDAPLLILDEPTASLDPRAEADLFGRIRELYAGRTVIFISHRFSSARSADKIYVLHRGRIVDHGTHDDLMAAGGLYAELFTMQAAAYLDSRGAE